MSVPERRRAALFVIVCALLVGSALAFATGGNQLGSTGAATFESGGAKGAAARSASRSATARAERRLEREVRTAAHGFLAAFLPYEVGELGPEVRRALRAGATPGFAQQMLSRPPVRAPPRMRSSVRLGPIAVAFVSVVPPRVVISATAERGTATEQISFVFERRGSAWLASGPGE